MLLPLHLATGVAMGEDVADLADRDDGASRLRGALQEIAVRRRHGEVLAMGRADEILRIRPDERPRDNASDVQRIAKAARDAAKLI